MKVQATAQMCACCFQAVTNVLQGKSKPSEFKHEASMPLFVTWRDAKTNRGCIGTFQSGPISKLIPQYAKISAFNDTRFPPVTLQSLPTLTVSVSLLGQFEKGKGPLDWELGRHGVIIEFEHRGEYYQSTFLPDFAKEEGEDKDGVIRQLIRKAGFSESPQLVFKKIALTTYEVSRFTLSHSEWLGMC